MLPFAEDIHFRHLTRREFDQVDLATVALEIARDEYPGLDVASWREQLDGLGKQVRRRLCDCRGTESVIGGINHCLFVEMGFRGNHEDYYDPRNSFLNDVLQRKLGIPITLSLVYMTVAHCLGLELQGVGMPAHFVLKVPDSEPNVFIDPFHAGAVLTRETCELRVSQVLGLPVMLDREQLEPSGLDQVILRLLGNLKAIYLKRADWRRALRIQERIRAIDERDAGELRDLGVLYLRNDRPVRAMELLRSYLELRPEAEDAEAVAAMIRAARRMEIGMN